MSMESFEKLLTFDELCRRSLDLKCFEGHKEKKKAAEAL